MPDNDLLNYDPLADFDLPPLPSLPPKPNSSAAGTAGSSETASASAAVTAPPFEKDLDDDTELPPLPSRPAENTKNNDITYQQPEPSGYDSDHYEDDSFELPDLPDISDRIPESNESITEEYDDTFEDRRSKAFDDKAREAEAEFDFDSASEYDDIDLDKIDTSGLVLEEMSKTEPLRTRTEESARNIKEKVRLDDMAQEMTSVPMLDDLSDEYTEPKKKAVSLVDKDKLEDDEKRTLKQRLEEDLSRRPQNYNAKSSKRMYDRLMEEKRLKTAKKGFLISIIPILMGLASSAIIFLKAQWGSMIFMPYVGVIMAAAALLLLIKSKHTKLLSISLYAVCLLMVVGFSLVMYVVNEENQAASDYILHIVLMTAAAALNIGSIVILTKNEAVNTYYSSKFSRK